MYTIEHCTIKHPMKCAKLGYVIYTGGRLTLQSIACSLLLKSRVSGGKRIPVVDDQLFGLLTPTSTGAGATADVCGKYRCTRVQRTGRSLHVGRHQTEKDVSTHQKYTLA